MESEGKRRRAEREAKLRTHVQALGWQEGVRGSFPVPVRPSAQPLQCGGEVDLLEEAVSDTQHHDSVTGTAQQHVNDDYTKRLYRGREQVRRRISRS